MQEQTRTTLIVCLLALGVPCVKAPARPIECCEVVIPISSSLAFAGVLKPGGCVAGSPEVCNIICIHATTSTSYKRCGPPPACDCPGTNITACGKPGELACWHWFKVIDPDGVDLGWFGPSGEDFTFTVLRQSR